MVIAYKIIICDIDGAYSSKGFMQEISTYYVPT